MNERYVASKRKPYFTEVPSGTRNRKHNRKDRTRFTKSHKEKLVSPQCGNCKIFPPLRFYVKSILRIYKVKKSVIFASLEALYFDYRYFSAFKSCKNSSKSRLAFEIAHCCGRKYFVKSSLE